MKEAQLQEVLFKRGIKYCQQSTICATILTSLGAYHNGLGPVMNMMKDHVLHLNGDGIAILAIDDISGTLQEKTFVFLKNEDIQSKSVGVKLFSFTLVIKTNKGEVNYKVRKNVLGSRWHKENLSSLFLNGLVMQKKK